MRTMGFTGVETARLLGIENRRVMERDYKRDIERYLPELYDVMCVAYEALKERVIAREIKNYGKRKQKPKDRLYVKQISPKQL